MASRSRKNSAPITFDLSHELIAKIKASRKTRGLKSASDVVRLAVTQFDFDACAPDRAPHRQISVRLPAPERAMLKRYARSKDSSVGELLRLALEAFAVKPARVSRRA